MKILPVTDIVTMYAVRRIGQNVPLPAFTFFVDVAEEWREEEDGLEVVVIAIKPYNGECV